MEREGVKVRILDRDFTIACAPEEKSSLESAASNLNDRLKVMKNQSKVIGIEHTLVLAALNLTNELLNSRGESSDKNLESLALLRELRKKVGVVVQSE